jgi:hypothetical protein
MKTCWRCGADVALERVGARDACEKCHAYLHCCRGCDFYEPGAHNDCREPSAEPVADKEQGNFCDFFRFGSAPRAAVAGKASREPAERGTEARARLDALFRKPRDD